MTALAALAGATIRGFSGFGAGMLFVPVAAACLGPRNAAGILFVIDTLLIAPFLLRAVAVVEWGEVVPLGLASLVTVPLGVAALLYVDPVPLRWGISLVILGFVAVLAAGWRYRGPTRVWLSTIVGAVAGFLSGVAQLSGPPVILYWLGRQAVAKSMRANAMMFFCFTTVAAGIAYYTAGIFTRDVMAYALVLAPVYALGLFVGSRMFGLASDRTYRAIAYGAIIVAALLTLPVFG